MDRFLTLRYYFVAQPDPNFQFTKMSLALGLIFLIGSFALDQYRKKKMKDPIAKKIIKAYPSKLFNYGIAVLILLGVRELGIPYLSMRIWWFLLLALFLYSSIKLAYKYQAEYSSRANKLSSNSKKDKYLPKKKK